MAAVVDRDEVRRLVDILPKSALGAAASMMRGLIAAEVDPVALALASAPYDDEEATPEEEAAVSRAREDVAAGRVISHEELCKRLGL